jgi:hypothetical protein
MATPVFTQQNPLAGAAIPQLTAQQMVSESHARTDAAMAQGRATDIYKNRTVPQLQGQAASSGQWYGSARQTSEKNSYKDFLSGNYDIQSGLNRQLDELTRQRTYAALGLIV